MPKAKDILLSTLTGKGWSIEKNSTNICNLPESVQKRYHIPQEMLSAKGSVSRENVLAEYIEFLADTWACVNPDETVWMLCMEDFSQEIEHAFSWNEFEMLSLQAAVDAKDEEWQKDIKAFWDNHLPICLSVRDGYSYYAIRIEDGHVVCGSSPEFEETTDIADSFYRFAEMVSGGEIDL